MNEGGPGVVLVGGTSPDVERLAAAGVDVERAPGARAVCERLEKGEIGCVVAGHDPPAVDGLALTERLDERRPGLPVVLRPADGSEALASEAVAAGVSAYVPSDGGADRLVSAVERAVGTARERSDRRERERALETLHAAAARIGECESVEAVCEATVEAADEALDLETSAVLVAEGEWLVPKARSADAPDDGAGRMRTDRGLAGRTFRTGESSLVEDVAEDPDADPADEGYRSGIGVPVGETAVFRAVEAEPGAFDESDVELAELLVAHTARALDRLRFEEELRRQNERLEEFAGVVSHDLRNPLNVAQARLDLARERRATGSAHLEAVSSALSRMDAIIDDTLTLAREGRAAVEPEPVDLARFAERCWRLVGTGDAHIETGDTFTLRGDPDRLQSLFENLFRNAVEHGSTSPRLHAHDDSVEHGFRHREGKSDRAGAGDAVPTVRVGAIGREGFYVEDDGPGIPKTDRERVFETGYTTGSEGAGLGLAIVEEVVEAHGWSVAVTEGSAGGARFEVTGVEPAD